MEVHSIEGGVIAPIHAHAPDHRMIRVTKIGSDQEIPKAVLDALVGLKLCTVFSGDHFAHSPDARAAHVAEVARALEEAGHCSESEMLLESCHTPGMYLFEPGTFEFLP